MNLNENEIVFDDDVNNQVFRLTQVATLSCTDDQLFIETRNL